jgi:AcrR family transcriptional regulator
LPQQTDNLRVRRTRKLLRAALIELIEERGFDRLTVGEITERAMVSRAAFYRNYNDKFHLVEQIFDEAIGALVGTMSDDERPVRERWVSFFEHISEYHRLYGALLGKTGSPWFANRMRATLADIAKQHMPDAPVSPAHPPATGLVPTLLSAMFVQTITWWLENDRPSTPHQIADQSSKLAAAILTEASSWPAAAARLPDGEARRA